MVALIFGKMKSDPGSLPAFGLTVSEEEIPVGIVGRPGRRLVL